MASYTITLTEVCAGGEHLVLSVTGDASMSFATERAKLKETQIEPKHLVMQLLKVWANGKTNAQIKTALEAGVTFTI